MRWRHRRPEFESRPAPELPSFIARAFRYDTSELRLWEADIIPADRYDEVNFIQRTYRAELNAAERDPTINPQATG